MLLLKYGGEPHKKNDSGQSPIDVADGEDIVEALRNFTAEMLEEAKSRNKGNSYIEE